MVQVGHKDYVVAVALIPPHTSAAYPDGAIVSGELTFLRRRISGVLRYRVCVVICEASWPAWQLHGELLQVPSQARVTSR